MGKRLERKLEDDVVREKAVLRERAAIVKMLRKHAADYRRSAKEYARQSAYSIAAEFAQRAKDFDRMAHFVEMETRR